MYIIKSSTRPKKNLQFKVGFLPSNKVGFIHHALFTSIKAL